MKLRQEERVQLPSVHLTDVEIPTNLIKSPFEVIQVKKRQENTTISEVLSELFQHFGKEDPVLVIKQAKLGYDGDREFQHFFDNYDRGSPLHYSLNKKSTDEDVKSWIKVIHIHMYSRGCQKFGIKVYWRLQFLEYLRPLDLKFQATSTYEFSP